MIIFIKLVYLSSVISLHLNSSITNKQEVRHWVWHLSDWETSWLISKIS